MEDVERNKSWKSDRSTSVTIALLLRIAIIYGVSKTAF